MLAILVTVNVIWIPLAMLLSLIVGFAFRSNQIGKLKKQIGSLEKEMLNSHAEILHLQEQMVRFQNKAQSKSLVVSMKEVPATEEAKDLHKDVTAIKKVKG